MEKDPQNVYEAMQLYYDEYEEGVYFSRDLTESFIRQKAWQGESDEMLQRVWEQIKLFELYVMHKQLEALAFFSAEDYLYSAYWLASEEADYSMPLENASFYLAVLGDFVQYIQERDKQSLAAPIIEAKQLLADGFDLLRFAQEGGAGVFVAEPFDPEGDDNELFESSLLEVVEQAIDYFADNPAFHHDYLRSVSWFNGLLEEAETDDEFAAELWNDYWYYFLFEYHLLESDKKPIAYFLEVTEAANHDPVVADVLLRSEFVLFYVERQPVGETVLCRDLMTDELFELPEPDAGLPWAVMRQQLFMGQRYRYEGQYGGRFSSVQVSVKLRNRIKTELERLLSLYRLQQPEASWHDLRERHTLFIRYMLETFVRFNQLTVFPAELPRRAAVAALRAGVSPADAVEVELHRLLALAAGFSQYDEHLVQLLWRDYRAATAPAQVEQPKAWAMAVLSLFSENNQVLQRVITLQTKAFALDEATISRLRGLITTALRLEMPDFRYLNEYGYVRYLLE